jgi:hypothetical protein
MKYKVKADVCVGINKIHKHGDIITDGHVEDAAKLVKQGFLEPVEETAKEEVKDTTPPPPARTKKLTQADVDANPERGQVDDKEPMTNEEIAADEAKANAKKAADRVAKETAKAAGKDANPAAARK